MVRQAHQQISKTFEPNLPGFKNLAGLMIEAKVSLKLLPRSGFI